MIGVAQFPAKKSLPVVPPMGSTSVHDDFMQLNTIALTGTGPFVRWVLTAILFLRLRFAP